MSRAVAAVSPTLLKPFTRPWWAAWCAKVERGEFVGLMGELARRGRPFQVSGVPPPETGERLVVVPIKSDAFAAWAKHYRAQGVRLPIPDRVPVVYLPAQSPPWVDPPIMMMAATRAEIARRYRRRAQARTRLGRALVDVGRLAEWDESDRAAIDAARDALVSDWVASVISHGVDLVPRRKVGAESTETADARQDPHAVDR